MCDSDSDICDIYVTYVMLLLHSKISLKKNKKTKLWKKREIIKN